MCTRTLFTRPRSLISLLSTPHTPAHQPTSRKTPSMAVEMLNTGGDAAGAAAAAEASSSSTGTPLALFWQLASPSAHQRLSSSSKLVHLLARAPAHPCNAPLDATAPPALTLSPDEEAMSATQRSLEAALDADSIYTVKRLVRGLASSRESARIGFSVALSEVSRGERACKRRGGRGGSARHG